MIMPTTTTKTSMLMTTTTRMTTMKTKWRTKSTVMNTTPKSPLSSGEEEDGHAHYDVLAGARMSIAWAVIAMTMVIGTRTALAPAIRTCGWTRTMSSIGR